MARTSAGGIQEIEIQNSTHTYAADAGGTDDYAIALTPAVAAYVTGQRFAFKANTANTTGATLNVNGLGAKTIVKHSSAALASNDIKAGSIVEVFYDGTNFQMVSMLSQAPAGSGDMQASTYDALGIAGQVAGVNYANSFTKSQAMKADSDSMSLAVRRNGGAQTAKVMEIQSEVNATLASFDKDGKLAVPEVTIDASGNLNFGAVTVIDDNAGTTTLQNIDAIDATTETTLEAALDFAPALGTDDNYVTDAEKVIIGNTSGTNTGNQTITNSSDATSHTVTLSASGGSVQFAEGSNITLTTTGTGSAGVVTIASTASGGNVSKVGTPANNQIGVWTGDGTIEGDSNLTWDSTKLSISAGAKTLDVTGSAYPASIITRTTAGTNQAYTAFSTKAKTSSDMVNGFGVDFDMIIEDVAGVENPIGIIRVERDGADNSGKFSIIPYDAGTQANPFIVLKDGRIQTSSSIELGHASDTTLSRVSAGVVAVEGVTVPTISSTNTLTNKRRTRRLTTTNAPGATPTTNTDNVDVMNFTGLGTAITSMTTNLSGTPVDGDLLEFRFTDDGTARAITWGASFAATTVALPTTTVISTMLRVGFEYSGSTWKCIATA